MTKHVAFIRAINVAGHGIVKMSTLRAAFQRAGGSDVSTFIQSGNVLFEAPAHDAAGIVRRVESELRSVLGSEPKIMLRTTREIEALVKSTPFKDFGATQDVKLYVAFLSRTPSIQPRLPLISSKEALEAVRMNNREVFIVSRPKESGFFGFPNNFIEEQLHVSATSRNWSTVTKIANLARSQRDG